MAAFTAVDDAGAFYSTTTYTGTGSSLAVTDVGFQPDFTWIKNRTQTDFQVVTDSVRGATNYLKTNNSLAQITDTESLKTFDSDGFTVGTMAEVNTSTETFVSWNLLGGTTTGIAGSPSITPTGYSFNATSGFSVINWAGTASDDTLPHGLGVAPRIVLVKNMTSGGDWMMYHASLGATKNIRLSVGLQVETQAYWQDTTPTSTLVSVNNDNNINGAAQNYIMYCFAEVNGFSKFREYQGTANADGTFVYTGFRPAFILMKSTEVNNDWILVDNKRLGYNVNNNPLFPNGTGANSDVDIIDILSNGFKLRASSTDINATSVMIYAAFAESPFVNSSGVSTNAR